MQLRTKPAVLLALFLAFALAACSPPAPSSRGADTAPTTAPAPAAAAPPASSSPASQPTPNPTVATPTVPTTPKPPAYVPAWREVAAPKNGFEQRDVQWIEIDAPQGYKLIAAVFRPSGPGPFPVVVVLHPGSGFTGPFVKEYGNLLVDSGFMVVAGLWFTGVVAGWQAPGLIDWPQAPPLSGVSLDAIKYADAIVKTARTLPGADGKRVGLFGTSMGAMASVLLASTGAGVQAVVADSAEYAGPKRHYPKPAIGLVQDLGAPLLMLHGTADQTAPVQEARDYEAALQRLSKPYEVRYYEGGKHVVTWAGADQSDARSRAVAFLKKHLMQ